MIRLSWLLDVEVPTSRPFSTFQAPSTALHPVGRVVPSKVSLTVGASAAVEVSLAVEALAEIADGSAWAAGLVTGR